MQNTGSIIEMLLKAEGESNDKTEKPPNLEGDSDQGTPVNTSGRRSLWPGKIVRKYTYKSSIDLFDKLQAKRKELEKSGLDISVSQIQAILVEGKINSSVSFFKRHLIKKLRKKNNAYKRAKK